MLFLNTILLLGALGIMIPIVIHLLNRRSSRIVNWGAMNFLLESLAIRNRRIQLEEALLMATRCLLIGLLALALARPFIPPGSTIPWIIILPLLLLAIVGIGVAVVLHNEPKWRRWIGLVSITLLLLCVALVAFEKYLNLSRFTPGAKQDIALIIDGSTSMSITQSGERNFDRAVEEARTLIKRAPRGHAFSLILGGPSPTGVVLDPTTDRTELEAALDELNPIDGAMATYQAFTLASLSLARGDNPAKQIVVLTDEQNIGWEIGKSGRWNFLREAFRNLPSEPQIMLRKLKLPDYIRNLAVTSVEFSRDIVGIDRPVEIRVTVENTGNEAVTPEALVLTVDDGRDYRDQSLGQLQPGEQQTVKFAHQFTQPGAHSLSATLEVTDDITTDNSGYYATNVADELKVLIIDGRPSARAFDRASAFAAVALAPSALTLDPNLDTNTPGVSDPASDDFNMAYDPTLDPIRFLVEPQVVDAPSIGTIGDFGIFDVVILGDVPRLPSETARLLVDYTRNGGGLLVAAGSKVQSDFYNGWSDEGDTFFLPAKIAPQQTVAGPDGFQPSAQTLTHPALSKVADPTKSDFATAVFSTYRKQEVPEDLAQESSVGGRFNNGDILLSSREFGEGQVILTSIPLDLSAGNLVTRQAFLPFLHELVYHLADPATYELNLDPGWEISIGLSGRQGHAIGEGLTGEYYASHSADAPSFTRHDPAIQFQWIEGNPAPGVAADNFKVEWTGSLQVPKTDRYIFSVDVDDRFEFWIDGKRVGDFRLPGGRKNYSGKLEQGKWYDFRAVYYEDTGDAHVILSWETSSMPRSPIPPQYFRTFAPKAGGEAGLDSQLTSYEVAGPGGKARTAQLSATGSGTVLKLQGEISSGLYRLAVPEDQSPFFADFLRPESTEIPFTVRRDASESYLQRLTESDYQFLENFVTLSQPQTLEELIGFLNGNQFGQELWKYLAMGAFFFLLAEIALSRWIAHSRRMGEEISIQFESKDSPSNAFRDQLVKMGKA